MSSHYIKCVVEAPFTLVFEALTRRFGNIYTKQFSRSQEIGVILGEQYFLRVNSDVAITIILKSMDMEKTEVEIVSSAGGKGIIGISWNAHKAFASEVRNYLTQGFKSRVEREISYFKTEQWQSRL